MVNNWLFGLNETDMNDPRISREPSVMKIVVVNIPSGIQLTCCIIGHFDDAFTITNDFTIVERPDADGHFNRRHGDGWLSC
jgi:hypothetical protein